MATAIFHDIWQGAVACRVEPFTTKRKGERVTRYRWRRVDGQGVGHLPFRTVAGAVAAAMRDQRFSDVEGQTNA